MPAEQVGLSTAPKHGLPLVRVPPAYAPCGVCAGGRDSFA